MSSLRPEDIAFLDRVSAAVRSDIASGTADKIPVDERDRMLGDGHDAVAQLMMTTSERGFSEMPLTQAALATDPIHQRAAEAARAAQAGVGFAPPEQRLSDEYAAELPFRGETIVLSSSNSPASSAELPIDEEVATAMTYLGTTSPPPLYASASAAAAAAAASEADDIVRIRIQRILNGPLRYCSFCGCFHV